MHRVALLATPGVGLRSVEESLRNETGILGVEDVEDALVANQSLWLNSRLNTIKFGRQLRSLVDGNTRDILLPKWNDAYLRSVEQLPDHGEGTVVVAFHPSLYSSRRSEFYSTLGVPISYAQTFKFDRVVLLIDDVYDMHGRLSGKNQLHDLDRSLRVQLLAENLEKYCAPLGDLLSGTESLSENDQVCAGTWYRLRAENLITALAQLMTWRRFDMIQAELLASVHNCKLTVIGVKHPSSALLQLVRDPVNSVTVYLSHPISRPRRALNRGDVAEWPSVVGESNDLGHRFGASGIQLIMPTAIDEYRLLPTKASSTSPFEREFQLGIRWPLLAPNEAIVNDNEPRDLNFIIDDQVPFDPQLGVHARSLERVIFREVPFRDHFLVGHTDGLFVYRPFFGLPSEAGGEMSSGVRAEIRHWLDSWTNRSEGQLRRAIFVHTFSDLLQFKSTIMKDGRAKNNFLAGLRSALEIQMCSDYDLNISEVDDVLSGREIKPDMLDMSHIDFNIDQSTMVEESIGRLSKTFLIKSMTSVSDEGAIFSGDFAFVLVDNEVLTNDQLTACAEFLRGHSLWARNLSPSTVDPYDGLGLAFNSPDLAGWLLQVWNLQ